MPPPRKKQRTVPDAPPVLEPNIVDALAGPDALSPANAASPHVPEKTASKQSSSLFVRSLPATTTSETLTELFSNSYPIKHATAVIDKDTQQCKGYGFVTFADVEDAVRAKSEFNGHVMDGKKLRVEIAEKRQREDVKAKNKSTTEDGQIMPNSVVRPKTPGQKARERRSKIAGEAVGTKLIVRNLPWSIKKAEQLEQLFAKYGKVKKTILPKKKTGLLAGFGFIIMSARPNAEKALEGANGMEIDGRPVAVDWAVDQDVYEQQDAGVPGEINDNDGDAIDEDEQDDFDHVQPSEDIENDDEEEEDQDDEGMGSDEMEDDDRNHMNSTEDRSCTLFVRNLAFTATDESLEDHFNKFGPIRYARVVMDQGTERSKGTGFVCFYELEDAETCLRNAPRQQVQKSADSRGKDTSVAQAHSVLQDENRDPTGRYTLDGRVVQVSRAVDKIEANRLTKDGVNYRFNRDKDKRRLYLLSEATIASNSAMWESLPPSERTMRESSAKQRKSILDSNPSLHLSLTRLSVRNIPRSITSKDLKQLAREAVVGFATDVKAGKRQRLSREELSRGAEEMAEAEQERKRNAKGIVRQAKIVFEGQEGSKVNEKTGGGRSRGYGFIEYYTHRSTLMGLRWLNGHVIDYKTKEKEQKTTKKNAMTAAAMQDRKKRLIVEFAIENAQVVSRRKEREVKSRETPRNAVKGEGRTKPTSKDNKAKAQLSGRDKKRKRGAAGHDDDDVAVSKDEVDPKRVAADEKLANRQRIIQRKRMLRRDRKGKP